MSQSQTNSPAQARVPVTRRRVPSAVWLVFGIALAVYAIIGYIGAYVVQTYNVGDGLFRIAQAHGVLFSRDPHLAAIGFVWMPLPVLSNVPLVLLLKPIGLVLWAGPLMSAVYAALALAVLYDILTRWRIPPFWRIGWVALIGLHPTIVQIATLGLSEAPFMAGLFLSWRGLIEWQEEKRTRGIHIAGLGAAMALASRYEALAWIAGLTLVFVLYWWLASGHESPVRLEANLLTLLISPAYVMMMWVFLNWQIMGNPIHFLVGPGSTATVPDTARAMGPAHPFAFAQGSLPGTTSLMLSRISEFGPLLLPATVFLLVVVVWERRWAELGYVILGWSVLGFTALTAWQGLLPIFARYFFWIVPGGLMMALAAFRALRQPSVRIVAAIAITFILLIPLAQLNWRAWNLVPEPLPLKIVSGWLLPPEINDYHHMRGQLDEFRAIGEFLNAQTPPRTTMVDATNASPIVFFLDHPQHLVMTTDRDFYPILYAPAGKVEQILIPRPSFDARGRSDIFKIYPDIYEGAPWVRLTQEFSGSNAWRLYEIVKSP